MIRLRPSSFLMDGSFSHITHLENRRARRYDISTLLQMRNTIQACPINRLKLNPEAPPELIVGAHAETVEMQGALRRSFSKTSLSVRPRKVNKRSDKLSLAPSRERHSKQDETTKKTSDISAYDGFARFLKEHNSPRNKRVTAGGRLVSVGCNSPPPTFDVDHINRMVEQAERRVKDDVQPPSQSTESMTYLVQPDGQLYDDSLSQLSVKTRREVQKARDEYLSNLRLPPGWKPLAFIDESTVLVSTGRSSKTMFKASIQEGETKYELIPPPQSTFDAQSKQHSNFGLSVLPVEEQDSSGTSNLDSVPTTDEPSNSTRLTSINSVSTQLEPGQNSLGGSASTNSIRLWMDPVILNNEPSPDLIYHAAPNKLLASLDNELASLRLQLVEELENQARTKAAHNDFEQNFKRIEHHLALHEAHISHHEIAALLAQKKVLIPEIDRLRKSKARSEDTICFLERELATLTRKKDSMPSFGHVTSSADEQDISWNPTLRRSRQSKETEVAGPSQSLDKRLRSSKDSVLKAKSSISALDGPSANEHRFAGSLRPGVYDTEPNGDTRQIPRKNSKYDVQEPSGGKDPLEQGPERLTVRRSRKRHGMHGSSRAESLRQELLDPKCWSLPSKYKSQPGQKQTCVSELARALIWKPLDSELIPDFLDRYCEQTKILDRLEDMVKDQERKQAVGIDIKAGSKLDTAVMPDMVRTAIEGSSLADSLRHRYVTSYLAIATGNAEFQALRVPTSAHVPSYQQPMRTASIIDTTSRKPTDMSAATMIGNDSAHSRHNVDAQKSVPFHDHQGWRALQAAWDSGLLPQSPGHLRLASQQMANQQLSEMHARNSAYQRFLANQAWHPDMLRMARRDPTHWAEHSGYIDSRFWHDPRMQPNARYAMV